LGGHEFFAGRPASAKRFISRMRDADPAVLTKMRPEQYKGPGHALHRRRAGQDRDHHWIETPPAARLQSFCNPNARCAMGFVGTPWEMSG
jgi:hypothetical protein